MKLQAFNHFPSSIMAQCPLRKKNKTQWWNKDISPKYNYRAFCKVLYKRRIQKLFLGIWQGEKNTLFLMSAYFILTFSLVKSFCLLLAKKGSLYRCQSGFEFSQWGLKMRRVIPEKNGCDSMESCDWCQSRLLYFSGFIFKLDQASEMTFTYQQSQYAD